MVESTQIRGHEFCYLGAIAMFFKVSGDLGSSFQGVLISGGPSHFRVLILGGPNKSFLSFRVYSHNLRSYSQY